MPVIPDLVNLSIFARRIVHQHHIAVLKVVTEQLLIELKRSHGLALPLEVCRRFAKAQGEYAVNLSEHLLLEPLEIGSHILFLHA